MYQNASKAPQPEHQHEDQTQSQHLQATGTASQMPPPLFPPTDPNDAPLQFGLTDSEKQSQSEDSEDEDMVPVKKLKSEESQGEISNANAVKAADPSKVRIQFDHNKKTHDLTLVDMENTDSKDMAHIYLLKLSRALANGKLNKISYNPAELDAIRQTKAHLESKYPEDQKETPPDPQFVGRWQGDFYKNVGPICEKAREGDPDALQEVQQLLDDIAENGTAQQKANRKWLHNTRIRVAATKRNPNDERGSGLDELFQTSETEEWIRRTAGLGILNNKKIQATSTLGEQKITWVNNLEHVRVPTDHVIFTNDGKTSGHSGALNQENRRTAPQTSGQAELHKKRNHAEINSSNPLNAAVRGINTHLHNTINKSEFFSKDTEKTGIWTSGAKLSEMDQEELEEFWAPLEEHRDREKQVHNYLKEQADLQYSEWMEDSDEEKGTLSQAEDHDFTPVSPFRILDSEEPISGNLDLDSLGKYMRNEIDRKTLDKLGKSSKKRKQTDSKMEKKRLKEREDEE
ncbi:MAG: hypothetical protein AAF570_11205 [Bacteroidota bacterium]